MRKILYATAAFIVAMAAASTAWGADPVTDAGRELGENVQQHPVWIGTIAALVWLCVRIVKDPRVPIAVSSRWRPLLALGLGGVAGLLDTVARGTPWGEALQSGLMAGAGSILVQNVIIDALMGGATEPGSTNPPPTSGAAGAALVLVLVGGGSLLAGCTGSPIVDGATAHRHAVAVVDDAAPVLREHCVEPMQRAAAQEDLTKRRETAIEVARRCDVPVAAYEQARAAVVVLGAALVAAVAGDLSRLPAALASAGDATVKLAMAIAQVVK